MNPSCTYRVDSVAGLLGVLASVRSELIDGKGYALVQGIPVADLSSRERDALAVEVSLRLGTIVPQDAAGTLVARVTIQNSEDNPIVRGFRTNRSLPFHVDSCDLATLLCVHGARSGGATILASTAEVYELLHRNHPRTRDVLEQELPFDRGWEGMLSASYFNSPVFVRHSNGQIWGRYERELIEKGFEAAGRLLPRAVMAALDALDTVLERPELHVRVLLRSGDLLLLNNNLVLHRRDSYADKGQKRLLLRTWVDLGNELDRPKGFRGPHRFANAQ